MKTPTLHTQRLTLKALEQQHISPVFSTLAQHPEINRYLSFTTPTKQEETEEHFNAYQKLIEAGTALRWGLFTDQQFMGMVALEDIQEEIGQWETHIATLGYWLSPRFHNQGYMTEAVHAVCQFGFTTLGLHKIEVTHISENIASQRVIEKVGFRFIGTKRKHLKTQGKWHDFKCYEKLK